MFIGYDITYTNYLGYNMDFFTFSNENAHLYQPIGDIL